MLLCDSKFYGKITILKTKASQVSQKMDFEALLIALLVLFFYAMPGYTVKRMFGA
jgi:hypothetical protein